MLRHFGYVLTVILLLAPALALEASPQGSTGADASPAPSAEAMAEIARSFLATLTPEARARAVFSFDAEARLDWHYIPKRNRKGLPFKDMTSEQNHLAHALLNAGLSRRGFGKAVTIMSLESLVREMEASAGRTLMLQLRDPDLYYFSLFGEPAAESDWGWSVEGHHVSLNFTVVGGRLVATTPAFFGAEPHVTLEGPRKGLRPLGAEEDRARALLASLSDEQRSRAILGDAAPRDIYTGAQRQVELEEPAPGLAAAEMTDGQKGLLRSLIEEYILNLPEDLAAERRARVEEGGFESIFFSWRGSTEPGVGHPHYYRVQGPTFLIEYDNIQNDANHSHTVWRDYDGDFGRDLLAEHHSHDHDSL